VAGFRPDPETANAPAVFPANSAQNDEQLRRQHDITIPATLSLFDPDQHAAAVDVGDL
jgi:hypothetical protein